MPQIYDRQNKQYFNEEQFGAKGLNFLYNNRLGRFLLERIFLKRSYSAWNKRRMLRPQSVRKIQETIQDYQIDMTEYVEKDYPNFRAFFVRELAESARPLAKLPSLISPADSRLLVYDTDAAGRFFVKGLRYSIADLVQDQHIASQFSSAWIFVYRLSMADNHHYIQIADGFNLESRDLDGALHTVSHFSQAFKILGENKRVWTLQKLDNIGLMLNIEVGAMQVGSIHNYPTTSFKRGDKKGYFDLGGSSIVHVFHKTNVIPAQDILEQSQNGIESRVLLGEAVGQIIVHP